MINVRGQRVIVQVIPPSQVAAVSGGSVMISSCEPQSAATPGRVETTSKVGCNGSENFYQHLWQFIYHIFCMFSDYTCI